MTEPDVHLVIDTSAITAFVHGSVSVGETVAEVADSGAFVGLSVLCLATARTQIGDSKQLDLLAGHAAIAVLPTVADWRALAIAASDTGRVDAAAAALDTVSHGADLLTDQPRLYAGLLPAHRIIALDEIADEL